MKKIIIIGLVLLIIVSCVNVCLATDEDGVISGMSEVTQRDDTIKSDTGMGGAINTVIGIIQLAGTGISVITVTILGARYMLASPDGKAEIKNRAMPVLIGMLILFGSVNIVAILVDFVNDAMGTS